LETVNALSDIGKLEGAAKGHQFYCDDNHDYVVKFVDTTKNKIGINEFVAGAIAIELELPTPKKALVRVSMEVIEDSPFINKNEVTPGIHIGSELLPKGFEDFKKTNVNELNNHKIVNNNDLYGVVAFDNWIYNDDRDNVGNNMIRQFSNESIRYMMIDFSHCFARENWNITKLNTNKVKTKILPMFPLFNNRLDKPECYESWLKKIEEFNDERINKIFDDIPQEWNFNENDKAALMDFLKTRRNMVRNIITDKPENNTNGD